MGETATRILLGFVIAGAVVLAAGVVTLIWLLATGMQGQGNPAAGGPATLALADGERILDMARGPDDLVLLLRRADGSQVLRTIDPRDGRTLHELPVVSAP